MRNATHEGVEQGLLFLLAHVALQRALLRDVIKAGADLARLPDPAHGAADLPRSNRGEVEQVFARGRRHGTRRLRLKQRQKTRAIAFRHQRDNGPAVARLNPLAEEVIQAVIVLVDATVRVQQRDAEGVAVEQAQVEPLRLAQRMVDLEELEILSALRLVLLRERLHLLPDQSALQLGKRLDADQAQQAMLRVDQDDIMAEMLALAREGLIHDLPQRDLPWDDDRHRCLGGLHRLLAV